MWFKYLLFTIVCSVAQAKGPSAFKKGFVEIAPNRSLYVEYRAPVKGKPTLYLVNGLTYSTAQWQNFVDALNSIDPEIGLVLYDMDGMGRTLLKYAPIDHDIPIQNQVQDLRALKAKLALPGRSVALGLSYGGALVLNYSGQFADDFDEYIAMSPFLERLPEQDVWITQQVDLHQKLFPFDPRSREELYDFYLRLMVATYPAAEPLILENPFKLEAIYRMVKGIKNWNASAYARRLPLNKVHIMAAVADEYVRFERMEIFLDSGADRFASVGLFADTRHKMPEEHPKISAQWVYEILKANPDLHKGLTFSVDPATGEARSGETVILLPKGHCESHLL